MTVGSSTIAADPATPLRGFAADDLACARGGRLVFEALSFGLEPGDALLLRGPNGSGKSTLLRLLAGFLRPSAGRLAWDGVAHQVTTVARSIARRPRPAEARPKGRINLVIATPTHTPYLHLGYVKSLTLTWPQLVERDVTVAWVLENGHSLVPAVRNQLVADFLADETATPAKGGA